MERKLASIQEIADINPIENADKICVYKIKGWNVVDSIGKYNVGDKVIYCEVDSWIPTEIAPFLSKGKEPKVYNEVNGRRLKSIKLRGIVSQGLLLPIEILGEQVNGFNINDDVSSVLGIQKWEAPIPACLSGVMKGSFPCFIPKTDSERIQNLVDDLEQWKNDNVEWEITEKCDGSSATYYVYNNKFNVCSRNLNLARNEDNSFWKIAIKNKFEDKFLKLNKNIAIQGELVGNGINGNLYKMQHHEFYLFNVYDIDNARYFTPTERYLLCEELDIKHVPIINASAEIPNFFNVEYLLNFAEDKSIINPEVEREGIVFKSVNDCALNFKCISNKFLLKN